LGGFVEDAVLDALKHHVVCAFDLAVAARVHHREVVYVDDAVLVEILEVRPSEGHSQVGDDPVGNLEALGQ
jgi:hypothetical protein